MFLFPLLVFVGFSLEGHAIPKKVSSEGSDLGYVIKEFNSRVLRDVTIGQIYGYGLTDNLTLSIRKGDGVTLVNGNHFDASRPTVLFVHGIGDWEDTVTPLAQAILARNDSNFLFLDWSALVDRSTRGDFLNSCKNSAPAAIKLAPLIAKLLIGWFDTGVCDRTFHIIGYSLDAELAGMIAYEVQRQSKLAYKLGRLSGLDPFAPQFFPPKEIYRHIQYTDATFIVIFHTNPRNLGAPIALGDSDFFFNNPDAVQPGCRTDECSHARSLRLFIESINARSVKEFLYCSKADSWEDFKTGNDNRDDIVVAGYDTPAGTEGSFYCRTGSSSPYSLGVKGARYSS